MSQKPATMWPFLQNIGLMLTYECQVSCPHCIVECSPRRTEEMDEARALDWIAQIARYRNHYIKVLSLTGGEPLIDVDRFRRIAECGRRHGLIVAVVSNAYWAETYDAALAVLQTLPCISVLSVSTDAYHQRAIPLERVFNAVAAAEKCGIPCSVSICTENREDPEYLRLLGRLKEKIGPDAITTVTTLLAGRALVTIKTAIYEQVCDPAPYYCEPASAPVIFPDGRMIACIGPLITLKSDHPLVLGNAYDEPLEQIFERAEVNPVLHALRVWGPKKLVELARAGGIQSDLPQTYAAENICDACYQLFSSPRLVPFFGRLQADPEFARTTAYARAYFLKENEMAERIIGTGVEA